MASVTTVQPGSGVAQLNLSTQTTEAQPVPPHRVLIPLSQLDTTPPALMMHLAAR